MDCVVASATSHELIDSATCSLTHGETDLTEITDSYVCGIADAPLLGDTIGRCLDRAAARWARSRGAGFAEP